jgi:hypothetical protein
MEKKYKEKICPGNRKYHCESGKEKKDKQAKRRPKTKDPLELAGQQLAHDLRHIFAWRPQREPEPKRRIRLSKKKMIKKVI